VLLFSGKPEKISLGRYEWYLFGRALIEVAIVLYIYGAGQDGRSYGSTYLPVVFSIGHDPLAARWNSFVA
jgi:hypothetical protein